MTQNMGQKLKCFTCSNIEDVSKKASVDNRKTFITEIVNVTTQPYNSAELFRMTEQKEAKGRRTEFRKR